MIVRDHGAGVVPAQQDDAIKQRQSTQCSNIIAQAAGEGFSGSRFGGEARYIAARHPLEPGR